MTTTHPPNLSPPTHVRADQLTTATTIVDPEDLTSAMTVDSIERCLVLDVFPGVRLTGQAIGHDGSILSGVRYRKVREVRDGLMIGAW